MSQIKSERLGQDSNRTRELGPLFRRFPMGIGHPLGGWDAPAAGPLQPRGPAEAGPPARLPGALPGRITPL